MRALRRAYRVTHHGVSGGFRATRRWIPPLDHAIRAHARYGANGGDRLAAAVTFYAFLSFFPILALLYSALGFVVDSHPGVKTDVIDQINGYLPGLADKLNIASLGATKVGVGLLGLAGLLLAGVGWVSALRDAIRTMWHQELGAGNFITRRLRDIRVLLGLGALMAVSLALTSAATNANGALLRVTGLGHRADAAGWVTSIVSFLLALFVDTLVFLYLFWRLPKQTNRRAVVRAALLGAAGIELLKLLATWLVGLTTDNPMYGTFAVLVGLLVWINVIMRWTLFAAAWAVTSSGSSDVEPSGSAIAAAEAERAAAEAERTTADGAGPPPAPPAHPTHWRWFADLFHRVTPHRAEPPPAGDGPTGDAAPTSETVSAETATTAHAPRKGPERPS